MKAIQYKTILFLALAAVFATGCTKDSDVEYPRAPTNLLIENFDNPDLAATGWTRYAEIGTTNWIQKAFSNDGYAAFSSFGSGNPANVAWLISPPIDMDKQNGEKLFFQNAQDGFVRNVDNSLELYVSTNYDVNNFAGTNWEKVPFRVATQNTTRFIYINSGIIDLSSYTGTLNFAFKVKGNTVLTGGYQIDNVRVFYK